MHSRQLLKQAIAEALGQTARCKLNITERTEGKMDIAIRTPKEASGLISLRTTPHLFFTLGEGNDTSSSAKIIKELRTIYGKSEDPKPCIIFKDPQSILAHFDGLTHLRETRRNAVVILEADDTTARKCFSPLFLGRPSTAKRMPAWMMGLPIFWGCVANPKLTEARIATTAKQIYSDFEINFLERLKQNNWPWGEPRKKDGDGAKRRDSRRRENVQAGYVWMS